MDHNRVTASKTFTQLCVKHISNHKSKELYNLIDILALNLLFHCVLISHCSKSSDCTLIRALRENDGSSWHSAERRTDLPQP